MSILPDALVQIVQALCADENLALWFESLADDTVSARAAEFRQMAARMKAGGADPELTQAIGLLSDSEVYEGVLTAFQQLRAEL